MDDSANLIVVIIIVIIILSVIVFMAIIVIPRKEKQVRWLIAPTHPTDPRQRLSARQNKNADDEETTLRTDGGDDLVYDDMYHVRLALRY